MYQKRKKRGRSGRTAEEGKGKSIFYIVSADVRWRWLCNCSCTGDA